MPRPPPIPPDEYGPTTFRAPDARRRAKRGWLFALGITAFEALIVTLVVRHPILRVVSLTLAGPGLAFAAALLFNLRAEWRPVPRRWPFLLAAMTVPAWTWLLAPLFMPYVRAWPTEEASSLAAVGAAAGILGGLLSLAERSGTPLLVLGVVGSMIAAPSWGLRPVPRDWTPIATMPAVTAAVLLVIAWRSARHLRRLTRDRAACMSCGYLAAGLARCPECGGNPCLDAGTPIPVPDAGQPGAS